MRTKQGKGVGVRQCSPSPEKSFLGRLQSQKRESREKESPDASMGMAFWAEGLAVQRPWGRRGLRWRERQEQLYRTGRKQGQVMWHLAGCSQRLAFALMGGRWTAL